jgi:hypothetical protein
MVWEGRHEFHWDATFAGHAVVAVEEERLLVWDLATGRLLLATAADDVPRRAGGLRSLAVGAGVAVTGTEGGYLLQWDLADGRLLARTAAHGGYVARVAISTDGTPAVLSLGGEDRWTGTVCFHDLDGLRRTGEVATPEETSCGGRTVLDGQRRAVTVAESGLLTVWDPTTAVPVAQFSTTAHPIGTLAFAAGGAGAVLGESRALRIVGLRDGVVRGTIRTDFTFDVNNVAACGRFVFAAQGGSIEGRTNLLELTDPLTQDAKDRPRLIDAAPATIGGRAVVVAVDEDGPYRVHDSTDGRELRSVGERTNKHRSVGGRLRLRTVSVGGRDLVLSMSELVPTIVDPATGEIRTAPRPSVAGPILSAAATRDGLAAMVDFNGTLAVWDVATLTLRASTHIAKSLRATSVALGDLHGRTVSRAGGRPGPGGTAASRGRGAQPRAGTGRGDPPPIHQRLRPDRAPARRRRTGPTGPPSQVIVVRLKRVSRGKALMTGSENAFVTDDIGSSASTSLISHPSAPTTCEPSNGPERRTYTRPRGPGYQVRPAQTESPQ